MHHSISQMKHQLDATLCRIYFCRVTLHVSGASANHQEYLKLVRRSLVHVLSLQVSHHISLLGPEHVEWPCRNKTCTVLHQVGVSFDLYYDARKHKIKICIYTYSMPVTSLLKPLITTRKMLIRKGSYIESRWNHGVLISELSNILEATLQRNTEANSVYRKVYLFEEYNR